MPSPFMLSSDFLGWNGAVEEPLRPAAKGEASAAVFRAPAGDPHAAAYAVLAYLHGVVLMARAANDPDPIIRLSRQAVVQVAAGGAATLDAAETFLPPGGPATRTASNSP